MLRKPSAKISQKDRAKQEGRLSLDEPTPELCASVYPIQLSVLLGDSVIP